MANYEIESVDLAVNIAAAENIATQVTGAQPLEVTIGKAAEMDVGQAVNYIKSGKAEIADAVDEGIAEIGVAAANLANRDLSNLSTAGNAKFAAKQNVIGDLSTIRSGAAAGATAVQPEDLSSVVHIAGTETITGNKIFTGTTTKQTSAEGQTTINFKNTAVTRGTAPTANCGAVTAFLDTANKYIGGTWVTYFANGDTSNRLRVYKGQSADAYADLGITYKVDGTVVTFAPTPADTTTTSGTQIATTGWVNSVGNNVMHLTGDETVGGLKTFTGLAQFVEDAYSILVVRNTAYNYAQTPANDEILGGLWYCDKSGEIISQYYAQYNSDGTGFAGIELKNHVGDTEKIGINFGSGGGFYTEAPTPTDTTTTSGTQMATTGWVNSTGNNVMHLSDTETITGNKIFTGTLTKQTSAVGNTTINFKNTAVTRGTAPTANCGAITAFLDTANKYIGAHYMSYFTSGNISQILRVYKGQSTDTYVDFTVGYPASGDPYAESPALRPNGDDTRDLGTSSRRWKQLYAGTTTIATSDERAKQGIESVPDAVLDAWGEVEFYRYKFNDAVEQKGFDAARYHTGVVAQRIMSVFTAHGLNAADYGLLCYDEWEAEPEEVDENGDIVTPAIEAGNRYAVRYEECLCMEAAYQRKRADRMEARLAALEARV